MSRKVISRCRLSQINVLSYKAFIRHILIFVGNIPYIECQSSPHLWKILAQNQTIAWKSFQSHCCHQLNWPSEKWQNFKKCIITHKVEIIETWCSIEILSFGFPIFWIFIPRKILTNFWDRIIFRRNCASLKRRLGRKVFSIVDEVDEA